MENVESSRGGDYILKKCIFITVLIAISIACIVALIISLFHVADAFSNPGSLTITPSTDITVNYNNYILNTGSFDYKYGMFAWSYNDDLNIVDNTDTSKKIENVGNTFQLHLKGVVYLKHGRLTLVDENNNHSLIAENVEKFIVRRNEILYTSCAESCDSRLYVCNTETMQSIELSENVVAFSVDEGQMYVLTRNTAKGLMDGTLTVFSGNKPTKTVDFHLPYLPFDFMVVGETIIFENENDMVLFDLKEEKETRLSISDRTIRDELVYIANNKYIFVSYQSLEYDGSIIKESKHEANGLWRIDLSTMQKEKISDNTFENLFLCGNDFLVGTIQGDVYTVLNDGNTLKLIE